MDLIQGFTPNNEAAGEISSPPYPLIDHHGIFRPLVTKLFKQLGVEESPGTMYLWALALRRIAPNNVLEECREHLLRVYDEVGYNYGKYKYQPRRKHRIIRSLSVFTSSKRRPARLQKKINSRVNRVKPSLAFRKWFFSAVQTLKIPSLRTALDSAPAVDFDSMPAHGLTAQDLEDVTPTSSEISIDNL